MNDIIDWPGIAARAEIVGLLTLLVIIPAAWIMVRLRSGK